LQGPAAGFPTSQPAPVVLPVEEISPTTQPTTQPSFADATTQPSTTQPAVALGATTQPDVESPDAVTELPSGDATASAATQPTMPEDQGAATSNAVTVLDDKKDDDKAQANASADDLASAARALADAAGHMANAADDLAHYAEGQPQSKGSGKKTSTPTTQRAMKAGSGRSTITAVPLEDGN
jgi:hypothetical protein